MGIIFDLGIDVIYYGASMLTARDSCVRQVPLGLQTVYSARDVSDYISDDSESEATSFWHVAICAADKESQS